MQWWTEQAEVRRCQWCVKSANRTDTLMTDTLKDIHAFERAGLFVSCYSKHSATPRRDPILPPRCKNRNQCLKLVWGKMNREASATMFRSFWCLGNAHSIIKAAPHVKLFVQFPQQQPSWELVMESCSFERVSIYTCQVFVFRLKRRLDGNLHYFYITFLPCLIFWRGTKKDGGICNAAYWSCSLVSLRCSPVSGVECYDL